MEIARLWGHDREWVYTLSPEDVTWYLGWYRVHLDPTGERTKKAKGQGAGSTGWQARNKARR